MNVVYPAGPIQGLDLLASLRNIDAGLRVTRLLLESGFAPVPVFSAFQFIMRADVELEAVYAYSLALLRKSDAVLMLGGWESSIGAVREKRVAEALGIPVFPNLVELCQWRDKCP